MKDEDKRVIYKGRSVGMSCLTLLATDSKNLVAGHPDQIPPKRIVIMDDEARKRMVEGVKKITEGFKPLIALDFSSLGLRALAVTGLTTGLTTGRLAEEGGLPSMSRLFFDVAMDRTVWEYYSSNKFLRLTREDLAKTYDVKPEAAVKAKKQITYGGRSSKPYLKRGKGR